MQLQLTTTGAVEESIRTLTRFLKTYQERHPGISFDLRNFGWDEAFRSLASMATAKSGADVSEIGAPWVPDFVAMDSLRPFTRAEVQAVGSAQAFFPAPWANAVVSPSSLTPGASPDTPSAPGVYALPARVDVRVLYYWRDMLEGAGVDPATAFITPERLEQTLETLRARGGTYPWLYQPHATRSWVYIMASWIWTRGGRITDEAGMPVFDEPEAIDGMAAFFRLHRFQDPGWSGSGVSDENVEQLFTERRAAVMVNSTHYHVHLLHNENPWAATGPGEVLSRLGAAQLPGPAFVGGTCFVIWKHSTEGASRSGVNLLTRLLNSPQMAEYCYETHMLPSRMDGFTHPAVAADPFLLIQRAALETGRTQPSGRLWMPIANGLAGMCREISGELIQNPGLDTRAVVERHAGALVRKLKISFLAS